MAEKVLDVERDEGDPVGITVDGSLAVTKVVPSSIADGNIANGDIILTINEGKVRDRDDYYYKLRFAHPRLRITFRRPGEAPSAAAPKAAPVAAGPPRPTLPPLPTLPLPSLTLPTLPTLPPPPPPSPGPDPA